MTSGSERPVIVWFRRDLRLYDNEALCEAAKSGPVIGVYIHDGDAQRQWNPGSAQRWWLHHSLGALEQECKKHGLTLIMRSGEPLGILQELVAKTGAQAVFWNRRYEPAAVTRDSLIKQALKKSGVHAESFNSLLLFEPWRIKTNSGGFFKVFTPFWNACRKAAPPRGPLGIPAMQPCRQALLSEDIRAWELLPTRPDWAGGLRATWAPGEAGAQRCAEDFFRHALLHYANRRDFPAAHASSRLSPYLHFGEISVNTLWHRCQSLAAHDHSLHASVDKFLSELGWREFSYHLLFHFPALPEAPFRPAFNAFPWESAAQSLRAWQKGLTGYPIVDAGMRELWQTGVMHNRIRMVTASFLTKHLLIHWQEGARWFLDTLVDADLASNSANWQWVAGCGADAAPYFRIFNPVLQGKKFDARGDYVRRFVPELARLPDNHIHTPWLAGETVLAKAGITLGKDYPLPIVDHDAARQRALLSYRRIAMPADTSQSNDGSEK